MTDHVFFYGTLMTPFNRPGRQRVESNLEFAGRGRIRAALFDLGIYPAAVPSDDDSTVAGEVYDCWTRGGAGGAGRNRGLPADRTGTQPLSARGHRRHPGRDGPRAAWAYFYNAPLGRAERIPSGDYLEHLTGS